VPNGIRSGESIGSLAPPGNYDSAVPRRRCPATINDVHRAGLHVRRAACSSATTTAVGITVTGATAAPAAEVAPSGATARRIAEAGAAGTAGADRSRCAFGATISGGAARATRGLRTTAAAGTAVIFATSVPAALPCLSAPSTSAAGGSAAIITTKKAGTTAAACDNHAISKLEAALPDVRSAASTGRGQSRAIVWNSAVAAAVVTAYASAGSRSADVDSERFTRRHRNLSPHHPTRSGGRIRIRDSAACATGRDCDVRHAGRYHEGLLVPGVAEGLFVSRPDIRLRRRGRVAVASAIRTAVQARRTNRDDQTRSERPPREGVDLRSHVYL
jgi:hypothetical protein